VSSCFARTPAPEGRGSVCQAEQVITPRRFAGLAGATLAAGLAPVATHASAASGRGFKPHRRRYRRPPRLPPGLSRTFSSRFVDTDGLQQDVRRDRAPDRNLRRIEHAT
jgi:hypothetical protein